jgi:hypothetical protein
MSIRPGTLCFIVKTLPGNEHLLGRVVEVIAPALPMPERGGVAMHEIDAEWLRQEHPGCRCFAPPSSLRPITPPAPPLEEVVGNLPTRKRRKHEPETA